MNTTLVAAFARQRLTSPMRVALAAGALVFGLLPVALTASANGLTVQVGARHAFDRLVVRG